METDIVNSIVVPTIPDIDAYIFAYLGWVMDLVGENLVFFGMVGSVIGWVVKRTEWKWDDQAFGWVKGILSRGKNSNSKGA
jgi:hypothetical protein